MNHTPLSIAALLVCLGSLSQASTVFYQSDFTGANLASAGLQSSGAASGIWNLNTTDDRVEFSTTGANSRSQVSTIDSWQNSGGFRLDVTCNQVATGTRFTLGLAGGSVAAGSDWFNQQQTYGIAFSSDGELENSNGDQDALGFYDGSALSVLGDAQGDITTGTLQTLSLTVTADSWSYSLNGEEATTNAGAFSFDTSKSYRFAAYGQNSSMNASYITNVTVTAIPEPATSSMLGLGALGGLLFRRRDR